jgi:methionine aminotransferase
MPAYKGTISSKLPRVGTTIFTVMSKLANDVGAINLSQGFPGFPIDQKLVDLVDKFMRSGHNQYAPMAGVLPLREAIAAKIKSLYDRDYSFEDEITVTAGATQALYTAITAVIQEDDEVIIFTPAYDCYEPAIALNGGKPIFVPLRGPNYRVDWNEVKKLVNRKTRMIIVNTPHNPSGKVFDLSDIKELESITRDSQIVVLSDEVYEHILFDGHRHMSCCLSKELFDRSLIVSSFGKTFHTTGWKLGYIIGPAELMAEFRKVHQFNVFSCNTPVQYAMAEYLSEPDHYNSLPGFFQAKRDLFVKALRKSRFKIVPSEGTYFQLLDYSNITKEEDVKVAVEWTKKFGVASIPISPFYHNPVHDQMLRFCFAKEDEELERATEILCSI